MRILFIALEFPPQIGGMQTMAYQLCKHLASAGVGVTVFTAPHSRAYEFDTDQPFHVLRQPLGESNNLWSKVGQKIAMRSELNRAVRESNADCVLCLTWDPAAYLARSLSAASSRPMPYFLIAHGMELMQLPRSHLPRQFKSRLRAYALSGASKIFAVSEYTRQRVIELGISPDRVCVIPNGVERKEQSENADVFPSHSAHKILLSVSRLVPRKGHDTVLRSLPQVIRQIPGLLYVIAGDGPEREHLSALARELDVEEYVRFCGIVSEREKESWLSRCDVFVLPCRGTSNDFEGFGIAYLEAMKYGKPVIGGRSGGIPEVIENGETGLLVEPNDVSGLARSILYLLTSPTESRRLGENARRQVMEKFRWEQIARLYLRELQNGHR